MNIGIRVSKNIGIGDAVQFTSVPENYFRATNKMMVDVEKHWVFDHNPYVVRDVKWGEEYDLWRILLTNKPIIPGQRTVLLCNTEAHLKAFNVPMVLNRPRLYKFEEYPFKMRENIIIHFKGRSHGTLPEYIVKHVFDKYGEAVIALMENRNDWQYSFEPSRWVCPKSMWDLAGFISSCRMFIGVDSGPSWIAQCYPDVITKKVRLFPKVEELKNWVPLEICRVGSYWDDRSSMIFNPSEDDVGFTWSYKKL